MDLTSVPTDHVRVAAKLVGALATLGPSTARWVRARFATQAESRLAQSRLSLDGRSFSDVESYDYRLPSHHPLLDVVGDGHPDDLDAFLALAGPRLARSIVEGTLESSPAITTDLTNNLVLVGSPEAEPVARLVFGYAPISRSSGVEFIGSPLELPFRWMEDPRVVSATCERYVKGRGLVSRPNWPLVDTRGGERLRFPEVGGDGRLRTDWLLVTVLPNFLTGTALESGRRIFSFAGTHGVGTQATRLLTRSKAIQRQISSQVSVEDDGFQAVLRVDKIDHLGRAQGSRAVKLSVWKVVPIRRPEWVWDEARRQAGSRYSRWMLDELPRNRPLPHERR